ncbi:helicase-exonuclease AddAB subunit AddA [Weissella viridescens]|uniref:helicase-exonuclease AddAB subunit AddA n=1 Tax=Weissella viridescens TaxID=1629 RepID=UPI00092E62E7|nr:helicase-exonuclease AddAB subunit AddA [Weissella viridescens]
MQFTESQQAAITHKDKNILVSASAGSGKTRVLVERVLQRLLAGENIDEFLIVTFTNAAAAEMKERLEAAIRQAIPEADDKQHLLKQLRLINVASISTLHAFAMRLIEQYHYTINLDPQFRLVDDAENTLIKQEVYQTLLDDAYEADETATGHPFTHFVQQFKTNAQDDGDLQQAVFTLFNFAMARPDTTEWLESLTDAYVSNADYAQTPFYQQMVQPRMVQTLEGLETLAQDAVNHAPDTNDEEAAENRLHNLMNDAAKLEDVQAMLQNSDASFDQIRQLVLNLQFETFGKNEKGKAPRFKSDSQVKEAWAPISKERQDRQKAIDSWKHAYFTLDSQGIQTAMDGAGTTLATLVKFTQQFQEAFLKEKLRRKVLDFNDLEHFALEIVQQDAVAHELQQHYREVMVDEYQDTNQLQEAILSRIAGPENTFQVGDIKQSIYKFRQADPTLFGSKLTAYPMREDSEVITLQENFRSQPNVTNFINYIFAQVMDEALGDVDYSGEAELVAGADYYPEAIAKQANLLVYLQEDEAGSDEEEVPNSSENDESYDGATGQIHLMALKIRQIMQDPDYVIFDRKAGKTRRPTYSDMTILVPTKNQNLDVLDVFGALDLPVTIEGTENFFQTTEISVMLSLLRVIDNPHQDIPLAAVLRSPLYGLNENDLALIRLQNQQDDFYQAVTTWLNAGDELPYPGNDAAQRAKVQRVLQRFADDLADFKRLATQNQIVDLIWQIYNRTGWLDYVGGLPSGAQRQANLHALYERAASYQRSSFVGLYQFIQYVLELQSQDRDLSSADANVSDDTIRLMTIHHSKGLEFPIVFVLNSTHQMVSINESKGPILADAKAGVGVNYVDADHNLMLPTPQREFVKETRKAGAFAEQLRVLYVALTRAEQNLYLVGTYRTLDTMDKTWQLSALGTSWMLPTWIRERASSYMDLAGMALLRHPEANQKLQKAYAAVGAEFDMPETSPLHAKNDFGFDVELMNQTTLKTAEAAMPKQVVAQNEQASDRDSSATPITDWHQVLDFTYPYEGATRATAYQSVSELKRLFEDPDLSAGRVLEDERLSAQNEVGLRFVNESLAEPEFMQHQTKRVAPAAIGTATHMVMQRVDLTHGAPTLADLQTLLNQLVTNESIEADVAKRVDLQRIESFFNANILGQTMVAHADSLEREVPFSLLLNASNLYRDYQGDEKVLVHGIIDGYFKVGDDVWLFDYKTDHIKQNESAAQVLTARYSGQINVYAQALVAQGLPYPKRYLYSFDAQETIELK